MLEASNVVKLTPYKQWVGKGKAKLCWKKRVFKKNVKIRYAKYLGKKYDLAFSLNNDKYYCSELVYDIYKRQFNYEICKPVKV